MCAMFVFINLYQKSPMPSDTRRTHFDTLVRALTANLKHAHSAVRIYALNGIGSLINNSIDGLSDCMVDVLPVLIAMTGDKTPKIREIITQQVYSWLSTIQLNSTQRGKLLLV